MSGVWVAALVALAAAAEPAEVALAGPEEEALARVEDDAAEAAVPPDAPPLPAAPPGPRLAESAPLLLERIEAPDGTATERLVEPSGEVVVHEVTRAGTVLSCRTVGALHAMRLLEQREAAAGEVIHVARDASGALLRYVVGTDGEPRALKLLAPAPR